MGLVGTLGMPVVMFVVPRPACCASRAGPRRPRADGSPFNVAILAALLIALGAVQSLVAIIAIYREGGILKRLRATPLSPVTILGAHVAVKLVFTRRRARYCSCGGTALFPGVLDVPTSCQFTAALLLGTLSILSLGFVIASVVPTARFAQPIGAAWSTRCSRCRACSFLSSSGCRRAARRGVRAADDARGGAHERCLGGSGVAVGPCRGARDRIRGVLGVVDQALSLGVGLVRRCDARTMLGKGWLRRRDSNPDTRLQRALSCR